MNIQMAEKIARAISKSRPKLFISLDECLDYAQNASGVGDVLILDEAYPIRQVKK